MKRTPFLICFILILALPAGITAQGRDMPHVTQIQVESINNFTRITWTDSPDAHGPVFIFRSARPFIGSIPANIRPVMINYGVQYYIDDTEDLGNIHYFIAASDISGRRYDVIIPRINSTSINFVHSGDNEGEGASAQITGIPAAGDLIQGISNIRAVQGEDRIVITYDISRIEPGQRKNAILYRSMQPVRLPQDLLNAIVVQAGISSPYIDFPVPGITWYYTIIFEDEISSGNVRIRPGSNTTILPVTITSTLANERSLRPIPLPALTLRNTMPEGFFADIPQPIPLSIESKEMLRNKEMPHKMPLVLRSPRVFSMDLTAPTGGEESALFQIIMEHFVNHEWENARISLQHYLSLPRSKEIEARARFYLGQTLYYTERYREALMEFLAFRAHYPIEAAVWIDAVLTAMVY
jgi:hypothetical protein